MKFNIKQSGLASVEAVLIIPVLLLMMYIMVSSARSLVFYEQRIIESRNAAYTTELYNGGKTTRVDNIKETVDKSVQKVEKLYAQTEKFAARFGVEQGFTQLLDNPNLYRFTNFPVQRYSSVHKDSDWFYRYMLEETRDKMDAYQTKDDPAIMTSNIKRMSKMLDNSHSSSKLTIGVGVSGFKSPVGDLHPAGHAYFMRNYHRADFSNTLDLLDPEINSQKVIDDGYNLKAGYSKEMKTILKPEKLFTGIFASASRAPLPTPGVIKVPRIPTTVGIVEESNGKFGKVPASISNSNNVDIAPSPGNTTTILGRYQEDMKSIIEVQLEYPANSDFGAKSGGYNVLNMPVGRYSWERNKEFLDQAAARGDVFVLATPPTDSNLKDRLGVSTTYGKEIEYLEELGYSYNRATGRMEK